VLSLVRLENCLLDEKRLHLSRVLERGADRAIETTLAFSTLRACHSIWQSGALARTWLASALYLTIRTVPPGPPPAACVYTM
jgi:hypothetical protein